MNTAEYRISNNTKHSLYLYQAWGENLDRRRNPVLIVPGYGMNSFIFSYHPRGPSLETFLVDAGFEVWRVDLRGQGLSRAVADEPYGIDELAMADLSAAVTAVREHSRLGAQKVDVIGASLGGTIMFAHAVLNPDHHFGAFVAVGSPVRWVRVHPLVRVAFSSPRLVGAVQFRNTRTLVEKLLPSVARFTPWAIAPYINPDITDVDRAQEMAKTVEDPNRHINRQIAHWIRKRDLVLRGKNISEGLAEIDQPLLCVLGNSDGIVPRETARFPFERVRSKKKDLLVVGAHDIAVGHADLFISNHAPKHVFGPIAQWLSDKAS